MEKNRNVNKKKGKKILEKSILDELPCHKDTLKLSISAWQKIAIKVINQMRTRLFNIYNMYVEKL